ncbi:hypothetical protein [Pantanalinema sp. GBBB05]|uniref:hypothetical protein n=1 Tax=Pantanalinema sp. GBBB05 TaxID=2604139 RepID=UPI001D8DEA42|nr:DUF4145 domain-containing protein [Pantanalinema sp. GBBB05]
MSQNKSPLDHPEIRTLFDNLLINLVAESDRGAVLIGTSYVDEHLRKLFEMIIPCDMSKDKRKALLDYPGPLSTLAAKTEVAFATRLIDRTVYDSLHALRRIRNDLAHSSDPFNLRTQEDRIRKIYVLGDGVPTFINRTAIEILVRSKVEVLLEIKHPEEQKTYFNTPQEVLEYISKQPNLIGLLEEQRPKYELVIGIALLCALIVSHREDAVALVGSDLTLGRLHTKLCREDISEVLQDQKLDDLSTDSI